MKYLYSSLRALAKQSSLFIEWTGSPRLRLAMTVGLLLLPLPAHALQFGQPIKCVMGRDCFVQNFMDHDAGGEAKDFMCGSLTYDKHDGTDIRVKNLGIMRNHVEVLAAANGVVKAMRDGEPDIYLKENPHYDAKKGCGNTVIISHEEGYETYYCHMLNGSVRVKEGDTVKKGSTLGFVGLSGQTEFPHLHFAIKKDGAFVDPYTNSNSSKSCSAKLPALEESLWDSAAQDSMKYRPSAFLGVGALGDIPDMKKARNGEYGNEPVPHLSSKLILWVEIMGARKGTILKTELRMPNGEIKHFENKLEKNQALNFIYNGFKAPEEGLKRGVYVAELKLSGVDSFELTYIKSFTVF